MTDTAKLSATLPGGDSNGLGRIASALVDDPSRSHVAIVLLDTVKLTTDVDEGWVQPTARIRAIEPIPEGDDARVLRRLLRRAFEKRTGKVELPLELEMALDAIAGEVKAVDGTAPEGELPVGEEWGDSPPRHEDPLAPPKIDEPRFDDGSGSTP